MSFKLFIYYCSVCGGWAALVGWALGQSLAPAEGEMKRAILLAMCLGTLVALALGLVDASWNRAGRSGLRLLGRGVVVGLIGCLSGVVGGGVGQYLVSETQLDALVFVGWALTGLLIGASIGAVDVLTQLGQGRSPRGAMRKMMNGLLGGILGGVLGGCLLALIGYGLGKVLGKPPEDLLSSSAWGFVALGTSIGLFIGLAQVIFREGWVRVVAGFRAGRELILTKDETLIGRAETCDIGLFGDTRVEPTHARIVRQKDRFLIVDANTPGGTFVNDQRITQPTRLKSGDAIRLGWALLRFGERQK
jgi:hypothetical protein